MAGDWIPMRLDLHTDPAVMRMADELDASEDFIVGCLHRVWSWASSHSEDGQVDATEKQLSRMTSKEFVAAMQLVNWLDVNEEGFIVFPRFETWMASSAKKRLQASKRKQKERCHANVTLKCDKNVTTEQYRREQYSSLLSDRTDGGRGGNAFGGHSANGQGDTVFSKLRESDFTCMETMRRWFDWQKEFPKPVYPKASKDDWRLVQAIARQVEAEAKKSKIGMFAKMAGGGIAPRANYFTEEK